MAAIVNRRRRNHLARNRLFRDRRNPFDYFEDGTIYKKFRFNRENIINITDDVRGALQHPNRLGALTPLLQVLLTLRFYASGSFQDVCAELIGVTQGTASKTIHRVTCALLRTTHEWISFPGQQEADRQKQLFGPARFPNVFGCIDGTHVRIQAPRRNIEAAYVNRKNYHSINVQVVCNAELVFIDVVARMPGSVHDSRLLRESGIFQAFESNQKPVKGFILGDSGYMLRDWLMTPVSNPRTPREENYNFYHSSTRTTVERAIGCAKRRWHCLQGMRVAPEKACDIITVCMILHNRSRLLKLQRDGDPDIDTDFDSDTDTDSDAGDDTDDNDDDPPITERARLIRGRVVRDNLIQEFF